MGILLHPQQCPIPPISLPSCIIEVKTKPKTTGKRKAEEQPKPASPKTEKKTKTKELGTTTPPLDPAANPRFNDQWKVPDQKYSALHSNRSSTPTQEKNSKQIPFCLAFHTKGSCPRGKTCTLSHVDPRDAEMEKEFTAFVKPYISE